MRLMEEIATELGRTEDLDNYREYKEGCIKAYQALVQTDEYSLDTDRQAQLVRPLAFGLLSEEQTVFARKRLIQAMENYGWRLGTGFLSTPLILNVLANIDLEAAYRLLENEEIPGWLFETMCGIHVAGENEFFIAPKPGGSFAHAKAEYNSVYGKVVSGWVKAEDGTYQFEVEVPANTTAKVNLPDGRKMFCEAGTYQF